MPSLTNVYRIRGLYFYIVFYYTCHMLKIIKNKTTIGKFTYY